MRTFAQCVAAALLLSTGAARGQGSREPDGISTGQQLIQTFGTSQVSGSEATATPAGLNQALLHQQGNANVGTITQTMLSAGQGNVAAVLQNGNSNAAAALQNGVNNRTTIMQIGNNNVAVSDITGYNTESAILQNGNRNQIDQQLIRDNQRYSVEQLGNNNNLVQRETSGAAPGYNVTMRGNGIQIMIEQGRVSRLP
ncbi:hypothetical protein K3G63_01045 [Hymenobacter sp. HSC-4F20]|uniref:hypothetical protein n=1 Tax=Hymenobacter sp. HSC-4F20 TaxID=2864135 RepID=UPI001C736C85|nr:hypothetical protein [Hymenobacter sp. HSC-4F20]MBX0289002.1 hypothetical protein [Hymenobacter sp. HSC-4F20]